MNHVWHGEAFHAHAGRVGDSVRDLDVKLRLNRVAVLLRGVQDDVLVVVTLSVIYCKALFYFHVGTVDVLVLPLGRSSLVERAVDEGLDLFAAQGGLRWWGGLCSGLRAGLFGGSGGEAPLPGARVEGSVVPSPRARARGSSISRLIFVRSAITKRAFSRAISKDLQLFGRAFFSSSGLVTVGVGHV